MRKIRKKKTVGKKSKREIFQHPKVVKKSHSRFSLCVVFLRAKVEEQRTVKKHMRGSTRVDDQSVLLHLALLSSECSLTTIAKNLSPQLDLTPLSHT